MFNWLMIFVPITIALELFYPQQHLFVFLTAALAILPLAGWMSRANQHLGGQTGGGIGGLLNGTFRNAAELIIAFAALRAGLHDVVKASIAGSIIGNILLVLGAAMFAGGLRHPQQTYNAAGTRSQATLLTLSAIALVLPAAYAAAAGRGISQGVPGQTAGLAHDVVPLSVSIAVVLLVVYGLFLVFSLVTHADQFVGSGGHAEEEDSEPPWPMRKSLLILAAATAAIAWVSEILVGAIEPTAHGFGLSSVFVGVFVVAILGNAAEHASAISAAMKNRMDLSLAIAIGSSVQVALFVAPVLVLASLWVGPAPMDLVFPAGLVATVLLSVLITGQVAGDGRSDWLRGVMLLAVYLIFGLAYFFVPAVPGH